MSNRTLTVLADVLQPKGYIRGPFGSALRRNELLSEGIPVYEQQHAINGARDFRFFISHEKHQEMQRFTTQPNDIIISCSGTVGKVSIITENDPAGIISQALLILRVDTNKVLPLYLKYFFQSERGYNAIVERSSGSVQVNIAKRTIIESIPLSLPTVDEQRRIVAILTALDNKIDLNRQINDNLQQQAIALYKAWFIELQPFQGYRPSNWSTVTLDTITSLVSRGVTPKYDESSDQIVINQKCIRDHTIDLTPSRRHSPKVVNEKWLQFGDFLINSTGEGTLGRTAQVLFHPCNMTVDSHVTIVRPARPELIYYIGLWGITHEREIEALHTGSTGQTELPRERVKSMEIMLPDDDTLRKFNAIISKVSKCSINNQEENIRLASLRDSLLPKLMSGEIDVSHMIT